MKARFQAGTRERIFEALEYCIGDITTVSKPVCVLVGQAGTGKSTIASEFAKRLEQRGRLGASFFFTRGMKDLNSPSKVFATIAMQLARRHPAFRIPVVEAAREHVTTATLQQLEKEYEYLLLKPIAALPPDHPPIIVVIDALDECTEDGPELLFTLLRLLLSCAARPGSPLRVFLTSRPEPHYIHRVFSLSYLEPHVRTFNIDDFRDSVNQDIELLIRSRLCTDETSKRWLEADPSIVSALVKRSDGLFIYARTVVDYMMEDLNDLPHRYSLVASKFLSLDELYSAVVTSVLSPQECRLSDLQERLKRVLGYLVALQDPDGISPATLEHLTGMPTSDSIPILKKLGSVVYFERDQVNSRFRLIHPSFREFMTDLCRIGETFYVDAGHVHKLLARDCFITLQSFLASHWSGHAGLALFLHLLINDLSDLPNLPPHIIYAARYLGYHFDHSNMQKTSEDEVSPTIASVIAYVDDPTSLAMWYLIASELAYLPQTHVVVEAVKFLVEQQTHTSHQRRVGRVLCWRCFALLTMAWSQSMDPAMKRVQIDILSIALDLQSILGSSDSNADTGESLLRVSLIFRD